MAKAEEAPQVFQALACGERGVRPRGAERPKHVNVEMRQHLVSFALTERQELAFEEFSALAHRFWREVSCFRVGERPLACCRGPNLTLSANMSFSVFNNLAGHVGSQQAMRFFCCRFQPLTY
jgi:hypothetical protein